VEPNKLTKNHMSLIQNEQFNESAMEAGQEQMRSDWFDDLFNADFQRDKADRALITVGETARLAYFLQVESLL
jgi:hypothetical protein